MVGLGGLEPPTSRLSGVRSNQAELQTQTFAVITIMRDQCKATDARFNTFDKPKLIERDMQAAALFVCAIN